MIYNVNNNIINKWIYLYFYIQYLQDPVLAVKVLVKLMTREVVKVYRGDPYPDRCVVVDLKQHLQHPNQYRAI